MAANYVRLKAGIAAASAAAVVWGWAYFDGQQTFASDTGASASAAQVQAQPALTSSSGSTVARATPVRRTRSS